MSKADKLTKTDKEKAEVLNNVFDLSSLATSLPTSLEWMGYRNWRSKVPNYIIENHICDHLRNVNIHDMKHKWSRKGELGERHQADINHLLIQQCPVGPFLPWAFWWELFTLSCSFGGTTFIQSKFRYPQGVPIMMGCSHHLEWYVYEHQLSLPLCYSENFSHRIHIMTRLEDTFKIIEANSCPKVVSCPVVSCLVVSCPVVSLPSCFFCPDALTRMC